jgi:PleD family two-component response regulator
MKILIVDDQELVILSLEKCLVDLGYDVVVPIMFLMQLKCMNTAQI